MFNYVRATLNQASSDGEEIMGKSISSTLIICCIFIFITSFVPPAAANPEIKSAEIVEFGIYRAHVVTSHKTEYGAEATVNNIELVNKTKRVPAQIGTWFGICFIINGYPEAEKVDLKIIWLLPESGIKNPESGQTFHKITTTTKAEIGKRKFNYMKFDNANDLVPGDWIIQIWHQDRKLAEKRFVVYMP